MELRVACLLIGMLLIQGSDQQSAPRKKPQVKKASDVQSTTAIEELQKQINDIVAEMNLLKEKQALQTVCLRGKKIHGKCFLAESQQKRYHTASEDCIAKGGTLSAPLSGLENEQLVQYVRESLGTDARVWLGVNDMLSEGVWVDLTGSAVRFKNWETSTRPAQPDGGTAENCAVLSASSGGKWSDESCRVERASVCEFKIV
ncbi:tetranectin [Colossoma macropomum]|uniref:tetranectin n=1 Tax=Colossoma macropomum TaxID=42526 RepID=UPI001865359B|nr:tetranectin [Colossoma macropomum]